MRYLQNERGVAKPAATWLTNAAAVVAKTLWV
jgi:hypothetical protein